MQKILITGVAGFIGFHLARRLLEEQNLTIIGVDNLNNYYSVKLKKERLKILNKFKKRFIFKKIDICNQKKINNLFLKNKFSKVIHLAAQAGVRYVEKNPSTYFENNLKGFFNILESSRLNKVKHLVSASTSSVYGLNKKMPFNVNLPADHPTQFYAASKRSNELMAHSYSHMFNLPTTLIRFFTAYGPWGRPDMALYIFVENIMKNKKFKVFNYGNHSRDFTYIDDITKGISLAMKKIPKKNLKWTPKNNNFSTSEAPYKILNLGNGKRINLKNYIKLIEKYCKKKAKIHYVGFQTGDLKDSLADIRDTRKYLKFSPTVSVNSGVKKFIDWYKNYHFKIK